MLSNEIIDQRLDGRKIKRIDNYIHIHTKILFMCLVEGCGYEWTASPGNIVNRLSGCPKCAKQAKLTNEIIDQRLISRPIKRISDYTNCKSKMQFKCLIDDYIWSTAVNDVINSQKGCPKCAGNIKISNIEIDQKLIDKNIIRIDNYINIDTKINFKCLHTNCNYIWKTTPYNIINRNYGCPRCSALKNEKLTYDVLLENNIIFEYQKRLKNLNGDFPNYIVDFYLPNNNCIIEYNGRQHYEPVCFGKISLEEAIVNFNKQQLRDNNLEELCENENINLICIDGRKYKQDFLKQYIINDVIQNFKLRRIQNG